MKRTLLYLISDREFWFIALAALGFVADAAAENGQTLWRILTIVGMTGLVISHAVRKIRFAREKNVPFLIVVKKENQYRETLNQVETAFSHHKINVSMLEKSYGLLREDWIYHEDDELSPRPEEWARSIQRIERKFWRLAERIPGRKVYHFFMNGPSTLALGLGAALGSRNNFAFYQYLPGAEESPYKKVIDFKCLDQQEGTHQLKSKINNFELVNIAEPDNIEKSDEIVVALNFVGHNLTQDARAFAEERDLRFAVIDSKFGGSIPTEHVNWVELCHEISQAILQLAAKSKRLHLIFGLPLALAFCVGSVVGHFVRADVYNYYRTQGCYYPVFKLEEC